MTDGGAKALAEAIPGSGLSAVFLGKNTVTATGVKLLLEAALEQRKLTGTAVELCGIPEETMRTVMAELAGKGKDQLAAEAQEDWQMGEALKEELMEFERTEACDVEESSREQGEAHAAREGGEGER